jgi:catechol 2,3-dioxygenase-like lactoylglutathione lyase family enzyme
MSAELIKGCFDVHIVVEDIDKALGFWRDILGFQIESVRPLTGGNVQYRLRAGQSEVKLMTRGEEPIPGIYDGDGYRGTTWAVENFDEVVDQLRAAGSEFLVDVQDSLAFPGEGKRICIVRDPEGNVVELESTAGSITIK